MDSEYLEMITVVSNMVKLFEESEGQECLILPFTHKANLLLDQGKIEEGLVGLSDVTSMSRMVQEEPEYVGDFCGYLVQEREQEDNENKTKTSITRHCDMDDKEMETSSKLEIIMIAHDMVMTLEKATGLERLVLPFVQKAILLLLQDKIEEGLANLSDARSLFRMVQEDPEYACDFYEYLMKERRLEDCGKSYKKEEVIDLDLVDNKETEINSEKIEFKFELGDGPDVGIIEGSIEKSIEIELGDGPDVGIIEGSIENIIEFELGDGPDVGIIEGSIEQEESIEFKLGDGLVVGIIEGCIEEEDSIEFELGDGLDIGIIEGSFQQEDSVQFEFGDGPDLGIIEGSIEKEEFDDNRYELEDIIKGFFNYTLNIQRGHQKIQYKLGDGQDFEVQRRIWWINWFQWIWWTEWSWWKWSISDSHEEED